MEYLPCHGSGNRKISSCVQVSSQVLMEFLPCHGSFIGKISISFQVISYINMEHLHYYGVNAERFLAASKFSGSHGVPILSWKCSGNRKISSCVQVSF